MTPRGSSGFALMLVLWTLVILSTIALTLAASVGTEVRASQESWNDLQAERLAKSGHEVATYLESRALGTTVEDLADLPVAAVISGLKYRVAFDSGTADLILDGENAKFDLTTATQEDLERFFTSWTGEADRSREIAASIADWVDSDNDERLLGAETEWYLNRGYRPRNAPLGTADLFLIKGTKPEDFVPTMINTGDRLTIRRPLTQAIATVPTANTVNPNYALPATLQSLAGMTQGTLTRILEERQRSMFTTWQDFSNRTGIAQDSTLVSRLTFARGNSPSILVLAHLPGSPIIRAERRTRSQLPERRQVPVIVVSLIERTISNE